MNKKIKNKELLEKYENNDFTGISHVSGKQTYIDEYQLVV